MRQVQTAFQIDAADNVATALTPLAPGATAILGDAVLPDIEVREDIPRGHKIALYDLDEGDDVVKYGVRIGCAVTAIRRGDWVHLHCMRSCFDEKSQTLDPLTGVSKETRYE